jgi:hypothetical protein
MRKMSVWLLSAVLAMGAGAGAIASLAQKPVEDAKAEALATTATYYCRVVKNSNITTLPTAMYAYYWSAATDPSGELAGVTTAMTFTNETTAATDGYADFAIAGVSLTYARMIFTTDSAWNGTQSVDITLGDFTHIHVPDGYKIAYEIAATTVVDGKTKYTGSWSMVTAPVFTSSLMRIWLDRQDNYASGYTWTYHYWDDASVDYEIPARGYVNVAATGDRYLAYFDLPVSAVGCHRQFKVYDSSTGAFAVSSAQDGTSAYLTYASGDNAELYYITYGGTAGVFNLSKGCAAKSAAEQSLSAAALKTVFEGYFTCADSKDNGYGAWATVVATWIHSSDATPKWWISGDLTATTVNYYAATADYATGTKASGSVTLQQQYDMMNSEYSAANPSGLVYLVNKNDQNSTLFYALGACLVASLGLAVALVYRRKRAQ